MNDYSSIIQVMGAMVLVSILMTNANRASFLNKQVVIEGEYETEVTAIAQDIMEESRALAFDETTADGFVPVNIPSDFSTLGIDSGESLTNRGEFDDFDDYNGWSSVVSTVHGDFNVSVSISYVNKSTYETSATNTTLKKMDVTITTNTLKEYNSQVNRNYTFSYLRSYYAD